MVHAAKQVLVGGLICLLAQGFAHASPVLWTIVNGHFEDSGTVAGWFVFDVDEFASQHGSVGGYDPNPAILSFDFTVAGGSVSPFEYTPTNSTGSISTVTFFFVSPVVGLDPYRMFALSVEDAGGPTGLTDSGGSAPLTFASFNGSYESLGYLYPEGGTRFMDGGSLQGTPVPEPDFFGPIAALGAAACFAVWRRKR
jgi:hypothetical protein